MKTERRTIDGTDFAFGMIPVVDALDIMVSGARLFGEPLFALFAGAGGADEGRQVMAVAAAMRALASHPDHVALKAELQALLKQIVQHVGVAGNPNLDLGYFNGRNMTLWKVAIAAVQV